MRWLALCVGFVSLLGIASCGINPQPEPPSADETNNDVPDSGGAPDPNLGTPEPDDDQRERPGFGATAPPEEDAGPGRKSDFETDDSNSNGYATDPGKLPPGSASPEPDAGAPTEDRDAGADQSPTYDAGGVLSL